jgi:hypothetical protein
MRTSALNRNDAKILILFLRDGASTREIDNRLGHDPRRTRGWHSWDVLKQYRLRHRDKGSLFVLGSRETGAAIRAIVKARTRSAVQKILDDVKASCLQRYDSTFVLAPSERAFCRLMEGETRNLIQRFFDGRKRSVGQCQFRGCRVADALDTVHFRHSRPVLFLPSARRHRRYVAKDVLRFDVRATMEDFLTAHLARDSVVFLCKQHHRMSEELPRTALRTFAAGLRREYR